MRPMATCSDCKRGVPEDRSPCPDCGSVNRDVVRSVSDQVTFSEELHAHGVDTNGKPFHVERIWDSPSQDGSVPRRVIAYDKRSNAYVEELRYPDRGPVRMEDKLSEHVGHGDDRPELRDTRKAEKAAKQAQRDANKRVRDEAYRQGNDPRKV